MANKEFHGGPGTRSTIGIPFCQVSFAKLFGDKEVIIHNVGFEAIDNSLFCTQISSIQSKRLEKDLTSLVTLCNSNFINIPVCK